jgi:AcrR family transcriptional regulator
MKDTSTITTLRSTAKTIFAVSDYDGLSMRTLSETSGIGLSSIYHFFANKDVLLTDVYRITNKNLGEKRSQLRPRQSARQMLADRITFQFEYMEDIVFVLKYYLHFRNDFMKLPDKNLPPQAYLHIEEVLYKGLSNGEFNLRSTQIESRARIITHCINGFLLEYFPGKPKQSEITALTADITDFVMSSLTNKEVPMEQK